MTDAELVQRLERLECDNRRLKGFALVVLAVIAALAAISATQPIPDDILAHKFELVDSKGNVRAMLSAFSTTTSFALFDAEGRGRAVIDLDPMGTASIVLRDAEENDRLNLMVNGEGSPYIKLLDGDGYSTIVGSADLVTPRTGQKHTTSAASIVMFGNDKEQHVIWQAP